MDILELLSGQLDSEKVLQQLSMTSGADSSQVQKVVQMGLPALLESLGRNSKTEQGASSLAKALDSHKDDKVDDIEDFLKNVNLDDGSKIIGHVLGGNNQKVQRNLAKQTGVEDNQVSSIMNQLAPLLLGTLGKQKAINNVGSAGIESMISGIINGQGSKNNNMMKTITNLLDADDDGNIVDDVSKMLGGFFKK